MQSKREEKHTGTRSQKVGKTISRLTTAGGLVGVRDPSPGLMNEGSMLLYGAKAGFSLYVSADFGWYTASGPRNSCRRTRPVYLL